MTRRALRVKLRTRLDLDCVYILSRYDYDYDYDDFLLLLATSFDTSFAVHTYIHTYGCIPYLYHYDVTPTLLTIPYYTCIATTKLVVDDKKRNEQTFSGLYDESPSNPVYDMIPILPTIRHFPPSSPRFRCECDPFHSIAVTIFHCTCILWKGLGLETIEHLLHCAALHCI